MIKKTLIGIIFLCLACFANEEVLNIGVEYNEASARVEAFKDVQQKIPKDYYRKYMKDSDYVVNKEHILEKNFIIENERILCPFYLKDTLISYAVVYNDKPLNVYYYNVLGSLIRFDIISETEFPRKTYGYSRFGNLLNVAFEVNEEEQFVYNDNGKLIAHWDKKEMKDVEGKIPRFLKLTRGMLEK